MALWRRWTTRRTGLVIGAVVVGLVLLGSVVMAVGGSDGGSSSWPSASSESEEPAIGRSTGEYAGSADAASPLAAPSAPAPDGVTGAGSPGVPVGSVQRSLVRTAQLTVEVGDAATGVRDVRAAVAAAGGFVAEESAGDRGGWVVLRVPADALDTVLDRIAAVGTVTDRSSSVVDATEEVVDLDARVASQQASVARVRALLAEATSIGDVVAIESELARREADLDSLTGRLAALRDQVAFSTVTVDLRVPFAGDDDPTPVAAGFGPGLAAGWEGLIALATATGTVIGFLLPFLPVVALLAGLVWLVVRRRRRTEQAA